MKSKTNRCFTLFSILFNLITCTLVMGAGKNVCNEKLKYLLELNGKNVDSPNGFTVDRNIIDYLRILPSEVMTKIIRLDKNDSILDAGSGESFFAQQIYQKELMNLKSNYDLTHEVETGFVPFNNSFMVEDKSSMNEEKNALQIFQNRHLLERPNVIAVTKVLNRKIDLSAYQNKLKIISGKFFNEIPISELGRPKLIFDIFGVTAYTDTLSEDLNHYLAVSQSSTDIYLPISMTMEMEYFNAYTKNGGKFDKENSGYEAHNNFAKTWIISKNGEENNLLNWILRFNAKGISVEHKTRSNFYIKGEGDTKLISKITYHTLHLKVKDQNFRFPELTLIDSEINTNPPFRIFSE